MSKIKIKSNRDSFYYKFVEHKDDIIGLLAYALYQKSWQEHKENLKREKFSDGLIPNEESNAYQSMFESQIPAHRAIAEQMLNKRYEEFASTVLQKIGNLESRLQNLCDHADHIPAIRERVQKKIGFFGFSFWQNVVASAAFPVLLGIIILLYKIGSGTDVWPFEAIPANSQEFLPPVKLDSLNMKRGILLSHE